MKKFKDIMNAINSTLGALLFGNAIGNIVQSNYKTSAIMLLVVSILFIVSYFVERCSK